MTSTLTSGRVQRVLGRLHERARIEDPQAKQRVQAREADLGVRLPPPDRYELYGDAPLAITEEVGSLYNLLLTTRQAGRVVEFGASHGISTIYLACALRDLDAAGTAHSRRYDSLVGHGSSFSSLSAPERERAAAEALASVRLEGLDPSDAEPALAAWAAGEITTDEMIQRAQALAAGEQSGSPAHAV